MSAFAARQQLWGAAATRAAVVLDKGTPEPPEDATRSRKNRSETPSARPVAARSSKRQAPEELLPDEAKQTQATSVETGSGYGACLSTHVFRS
jgi:polynucleotide 5'-hydroxyl-kinase GRC3/NOL9